LGATSTLAVSTVGERGLGRRALRRRHYRGLLGRQVGGERIVELRRIDRELDARRAVAIRILERDERAHEDAVLGTASTSPKTSPSSGAKAATKTRPTTFAA
jgi:hypothetical protein